jgi:hypothetical protein
MRNKRCEYCGHLMDAPSDNRDMAIEAVDHGRKICQFLIREGFTAIQVCNFCYAHICLFKHERPEEYEHLQKIIPTV